MVRQISKVYYQGLRFNAGIVFSIALLEEVFGDIDIYINPKSTENAPETVFLSYDFQVTHYRESGIPISNFGNIWSEFGLMYCHEDKMLFNLIEYEFVRSIDCFDLNFEIGTQNYMAINPLSLGFIIDLLNPSSLDDEVSLENSLNEAVNFSVSVLRSIKKWGMEKVLIYNLTR